MLDYLIGTLKIFPSNIEKCPSILYLNVEAIKELSSDIKNINNRIADNTEDIGAILKTIRSDTKGMNEDVSYVRTNGLYVKR